MHSLKDELAYFFSGSGMPYAKVSMMVAIVVSLLFTAVFSNNYAKDVPVAVIDLDNSKFSHELIEELNTSPYVEIKDVLNVPANPKELLYHDRHLAVLYLPNGLEKNRYSNSKNNIGIFYDNTNGAQTGHLKLALNTIIAIENLKIGSEQVEALGLSSEQTEAIMNNISLNDRELFNPTDSSSNSTSLGFLFFFSSMFMVFATIGMIPRLRLEDKWQEELLRGNPFSPMLRLVPYVICLTGSLIVGLCILRLVGDMNFSGNYPLLLLSIIMLSVSVGLMSLLFGWGAANPGVAISKMILFIPGGFVLGGASGPLNILPFWVQTVSNIFPLVWGYRLNRDVMRGASLMDCSREIGGFMLYIGILAALICLRFYRNHQALLAEKGALPQNQPSREIP